MPKDNMEDLPGTIQRSPAKAQRTYAKTPYRRDKRLGVDGRSRMSKLELTQAIARKQD